MSDNEEEGFLLADGLDHAFLGIVERFGQGLIACYDYDLVIQGLLEEGLTEEDAIEHFEYNILGSWVGDRTPCYLRRMPLEHAKETAP